MWITFSGSIVAALLPLILIIMNQSASDDTKASNATNTTLNGVAAFIAGFIAAMIVINGHFKDETLDMKNRALASQDLLFPPAPRQQVAEQPEVHLQQQQMQQVDMRYAI